MTKHNYNALITSYINAQLKQEGLSSQSQYNIDIVSEILANQELEDKELASLKRSGTQSRRAMRNMRKVVR
jgi:hypothetical protein